MRKNLKKQTAVLIVSAALAAQTSLAGYGAPLTPGDWKRICRLGPYIFWMVLYGSIRRENGHWLETDQRIPVLF